MAASRSTESIAASELRTIVEWTSHPVRARVLGALAERPNVTIREVAARIDESPRSVRHHVDALLEAGLIEVTGEENRRGVIQRRYGRGPIAIDDPAPLGTEVRVEFSKSVVRLLMADIATAAEAGTFARRDDDYEVRMYGEVVDDCRRRLDEIHARAYREIRQTIEEGREELRRNGGSGTEVISALFYFESPLWGSAGAND